MEPRRIKKCYPVLSPDAHPIPHPALGSIERLGVSWEKSIQEYAGSVGHVYHSGERPVSDIFRSGSSDYSGSGFTEAGLPTLSSLKTKMGFGEDLIFEDSGLAADWDIAMRMMEEFSRADRKLKRVGAIKLKRSNDGSAGPRKDGIGRSFSNDGGPKPNNRRTQLTEPTLEEPNNEDNESEMSEDYSEAGSLESLGYEKVHGTYNE